MQDEVKKEAEETKVDVKEESTDKKETTDEVKNGPSENVEKMEVTNHASEKGDTRDPLELALAAMEDSNSNSAFNEIKKELNFEDNPSDSSLPVTSNSEVNSEVKTEEVIEKVEEIIAEPMIIEQMARSTMPIEPRTTEQMTIDELPI